MWGVYAKPKAVKRRVATIESKRVRSSYAPQAGENLFHILRANEPAGICFMQALPYMFCLPCLDVRRKRVVDYVAPVPMQALGNGVERLPRFWLDADHQRFFGRKVISRPSNCPPPRYPPP
jgi:hypothetical protein